MKKHLIYLCIASAFGWAGCTDVNDEFEGLDKMTVPENVINKDYTLTAEDYATISALKVNGVDANALKAVKTNLYLTSATPAKTVLPVFMNSKWGTASTGSAIKMTYDFGGETPAYLAALAAAQIYELTDKDYETIWGVPGKAYLNSDKVTEKNLSSILATSVKEPKEGDYALVSYKYSEASDSGNEEVYDNIEDVVNKGSGKVKGSVIATYSRGFLLTDGTSSILVYLGKCENTVGDIVVVEGDVDEYGGMYQFTSDSRVTKLESGEYEGVVPNQWNATEMDAYLSNPSIQPIVYIGTLSITTNDKGNTYYNVNIEGSQKAVGSIQYPAEGVVSAALNGKKVIVTGYAIGVSSKKYVNTMATSVVALADYTEISTVIAASEGAKYSVRGTVCAKYEKGILLTDGTGYILAYLGSDKGLNVGDVVTVVGETSQYGGLYQFSGSAVVTLVAKSSYTYPQADKMNAAALDAYLTNVSVKYVTYEGTLSITTNDKGNTYYNVDIEGAQKAIGSIQYPVEGVVNAALNGKKVIVTGYAIGVSSKKYVNTMAVSVEEFSASGTTGLTLSSVEYVSPTTYQKPMAFSSRGAASVEVRNVIYVYKNEKWVEEEEVVVVNPADYKAMGEPGSHNNFSSSAPAGNYLPKFLAAKYPYANDGDVKAVVYNYYDSDAKKTILKADEYVYAGVWKYNNIPVETVTEQYAYSGSWMYDPNVTITLVAGKGNGDGHFQALTDWVWENIDVPAGVTKKGEGYVTSYGNNDYYFGGSEYQNNFDFRPDKWKEQMNSAYGDMTNEKLSELMWERLLEAVKIMLTATHPEAKPVEGLDVIYTVNFVVYDGSNANYTIQYQVTAPGEFTYVDKSLKKVE